MNVNWQKFSQELLKFFYWLSNVFLGIIVLIVAARILEFLILSLVDLYRPDSGALAREYIWEIMRLSLIAIGTFCFNQLTNLGLKLFNINNSIASWGVPETNVPDRCYNCQWFHGRSYNGNFLVCGIYPYGKEECFDFEKK